MIHKILIQEGYLVLASFIVMYIIFLRNKWFSKHFLKSKAIYPPFKKWTWNKPPENYRSTFYVDVSFGILISFHGSGHYECSRDCNYAWVFIVNMLDYCCKIIF